MKNIIKLSVIALGLLSSSLIVSMMPNDDRVIAFNRLAWLDSGRVEEMLGYDPQVEMIHPESDENRNDIPCIYLQGWPAPKEEFIESIRNNVNFPGPGIVFNFPDGEMVDDELVVHFTKINFGQHDDIMVALYVLDLARRAGFDAVNIFAHSRGAATFTNLVKRLNSRFYNDELELLGIDEEARLEMLQMVRNGGILLNAPLKTVSYSCDQIVKNFRERTIRNYLRPIIGRKRDRGLCMKALCRVSSLVGNASDSLISPLVYLSLPFLTRYKPWTDNARYSVSPYRRAWLNTVIHYVQKDKVVSNRDDYKFADQSGCDACFKTDEGVANHNGFNFLGGMRDFWTNRGAFLLRHRHNRISPEVTDQFYFHVGWCLYKYAAAFYVSRAISSISNWLS